MNVKEGAPSGRVTREQEKVKAGIKDAKQRPAQSLERDLNTSNTKDRCQVRSPGLQKQERPTLCEANLPDEIHTFYAHFDLLNIHSCKIHSSSRAPATVSIHSRCERNPAESEYESSCWA